MTFSGDTEVGSFRIGRLPSGQKLPSFQGGSGGNFLPKWFIRLLSLSAIFRVNSLAAGLLLMAATEQVTCLVKFCLRIEVLIAGFETKRFFEIAGGLKRFWEFIQET
jgi:hypothetical protein